MMIYEFTFEYGCDQVEPEFYILTFVLKSVECFFCVFF